MESRARVNFLGINVLLYLSESHLDFPSEQESTVWKILEIPILNSLSLSLDLGSSIALDFILTVTYCLILFSFAAHSQP